MLSKVLFERLYHASAVFILTGSGISKQSGLPTYRGDDGKWNNLSPEELGFVEKFNQDHQIVWDWYRWRQEQILKSKPNLGHYALVDFENRFEEFTVVTINVDGLHQKAGSKNVVEAHGNIFNARCTKCGHKEINFIPKDSSPKCSECGGLLRPDVFMVGDELDGQSLSSAQQAAAVCELFFVVGTSAISNPASALPFISKANGSYLIEINTGETKLSSIVNERIQGDATEWLPKITILYDKISGKS